MKIFKLIAIFLSLATLSSSCGLILMGTHQSVNVKRENADDPVFINEKRISFGSETKVRLSTLYGNAQQVKVEKKGHIDRYYVMAQHKRPALYYAFFPFFSWSTAKVYPTWWIYDRNPPVFKPGPRIDKRQSNERFVFFQRSDIKIERGNSRYVEVKKRREMRGKPPETVTTNYDPVDINDAAFFRLVNDNLMERQYYDTNQKNFVKHNGNSLVLTASFVSKETKVTHFIKHFSAYSTKVKVGIEWSLINLDGDTLVNKLVENWGGEFSHNNLVHIDGEPQKPYAIAIEDAITYNFYKFFDSDEVQNQLKIQDTTNNLIAKEKINHTRKQINSLDDAIQSTVTILAGDDYHASGFVVGEEGYILTNYHVAEFDLHNLTVIDHEGEKLPARVVQFNEGYDLCLIKIDKPFDKTFRLSNVNGLTVGENIYSIGTPQNKQLSQTLSNGIVSGERKVEGVDFIQTDVSVNKGSTGGPLLRDNGDLLGVVSNKVYDYSVQGLGFAIRNNMINSFLNGEEKVVELDEVESEKEASEEDEEIEKTEEEED
ncbi:S1C family serine protease [Salibacter halophilus]|uniref:Trypsin-like serine protease n=1 Tax=Salibacter halophilus TaxID=1803916 RepID=A0A6N6M3S5_9FLAO|nr:serine protease [Salibacter halophilus]KAB1063918.1 trypsin-like serine protease [Salibacter halophilus]